MWKKQYSPFLDKIPTGQLQLEWKPVTDFNNQPPAPVKPRNKSQAGGEQYLREAIISQMSFFGDATRPHKISLNFLGQ